MTTSDELGNYCHDHYAHPLLWCEDKKRLIERKNAEESMRMWRRRKAEEIARKERDKAEYYELSVKHYPWGRPGGGAPNLDVRRKDITAVGLHSTPTIATMHRLSSWQPCRYNDYFSQRKKCHDPATCYHHHLHHHMPPVPPPPPHVTTHTHTVRTTTDSLRPCAGSVVTVCERSAADVGAGGRSNPPCAATNGSNGVAVKNGDSLHIALKDHPSISFRDKGHVDIEVRYKPGAAGSKSKPMLEKIVVTESDKCPGVQLHPALKCSPQKKKLLAKLEKPCGKEPWGKAGPGGKPWRSSKAVGSSFMKSLGWTNKEMLKDLDQDNPVTPAEKPTFRKVRTNKKVQRCCELCICTCPAMVCGPQKPPPHQSSMHKGQSNALATIAPAPAAAKHEIKSKFCPRFARHNNINTESSANVGGEGGGVELVPLLARRRANNRPISLSSTDVTKRTTSNDRLSTAQDLRYLHDLNNQMSEKRQSTCAAQQIDRELCNQHFETFDTFWGRPGHGAPVDIKAKQKLNNLLYGTTDDWESNI